MPSIKEMFPSKYMSFEDFEMNIPHVGTVKHVALEQATARFGGGGYGSSQQQIVEPSWLLYFHEWPKPMKLKKTKAEQISMLLASHKTEDWTGKQVTFYRGVWSNGGQSGEGLMIDTRPVPIVSRHVTAKPSYALTNRMIPMDAVRRFIDTSAGVGKNWDDFLRYLKAKNETAFASTWGVDLEGLDAALVPHMKGFLDIIHNPVAEPEPRVIEQPAQTAVLARTATGPLKGQVIPDDDIPF